MDSASEPCFLFPPARRMGQITPNEAYSTVKMIFIAVAPNEACSTVKTSRMLSRAIRKRTRERRYLTKAFLTKHLSKYYIFENPPEGINSRLGLAERALPPQLCIPCVWGLTGSFDQRPYETLCFSKRGESVLGPPSSGLRSRTSVLGPPFSGIPPPPGQAPFVPVRFATS